MTVRPRNTKVRRSIASSSAAALALASVSLRFHNSSANSSPPSRPITSDERTWRKQRLDDGLEHLIARGVAEGIVDRLQAIDVEHDQRAARMVTLDVGDRAIEFALEAAPVRNIEQEVGLGGGLQLPRFAPAPRPIAVLQPADRRFGVAWSRDRRRGYGRAGAARRGFAPCRGRFAAFCGLEVAAALVFFFMAFPVAGLLMKACRDSPRQDSPFLIPCHALDDARADPIIRPMFLDSRTELTR